MATAENERPPAPAGKSRHDHASGAATSTSPTRCASVRRPRCCRPSNSCSPAPGRKPRPRPCAAPSRSSTTCFPDARPGYAGVDTVYHDRQHTLDVTLTMARLCAGYERQVDALWKLGAQRAIAGVIMALFHDVGYLRRTTRHRAAQRRRIHQHARLARHRIPARLPAADRPRRLGRTGQPGTALYRLRSALQRAGAGRMRATCASGTCWAPPT